MTDPAERHVQVNGEPCRVWEKGEGPTVVFLASLLGLPHWTPFLEALAAGRRVVAPSLPGFPGGRGHDQLDNLADWVTATLDLLDATAPEEFDLMGCSLGGALAAEAAAFCPPRVRRLVLVAPLGLFDEAEPVADFWAQRVSAIPSLLSAHPETFQAALAPPSGADALEWQIEQTRASEATARLMWPNCDVGLRKRLHRIQAPTLLVWGSEDRVVPASYAKRFASGISGATEVRTIPDAGHLVDLDAPAALAGAVSSFLDA